MVLPGATVPHADTAHHRRTTCTVRLENMENLEANILKELM